MKRRFAIIVVCCLLFVSCMIPVYAETAASAVQSYSTVTSDGDCQVSITVTFRLEQAVSDITFPVPANASNVKKDGSLVRTTKTDTATYIELGDYIGGLIGTFTMRFEYTLPGVVKNVVVDNKGNLMLELPLLSGFAFPVETMDFTITLPAVIEAEPKYTSVYYQDTIKSHLESAQSGNMISGRTTSVLEDHESLTMILDVPEEMFPSISTYHRSGNPEIIPMAICAGLALIYWIIFLRTLPVLPSPYKSAPEGITAGELGCRLTLSGADLSMMVFSWAQLGYITIQLDDRGRVILHKRMDMGNERNLFEVRIFQSLFGKQYAVEATGYSFARLSRKVRTMVPGERSVCLPRSGNVKIFRVLCCCIQIFCAVCFAMNLSSYGVLQAILSIGLSILGIFCAWKIQAMFYHIHLRSRLPLIVGIAAGVLWLLAGLISGQILIALVVVLVQALAGFAAAYGGRRSDVGRTNISQILGLRKYLENIDKEEVVRMSRSDPDFFFNMAPYALALGVGKQFANQFGRKPMPVCPYIVCNIRGRLNAQDWMLIMQETARSMNLLLRRLDLERWAVVRFR